MPLQGFYANFENWNPPVLNRMNRCKLVNIMPAFEICKVRRMRYVRAAGGYVSWQKNEKCVSFPATKIAIISSRATVPLMKSATLPIAKAMAAAILLAPTLMQIYRMTAIACDRFCTPIRVKSGISRASTIETQWRGITQVVKPSRYASLTRC